ncbi:MAG: hypothetical protein GXP62_18255 [Oligoflexia bacterium]|nr:hypothetical protein [Oligoflexia bacterium]
MQRLRASGIYAPLRVLAFQPAVARFLAASLAFPVSPALAQSLAQSLADRSAGNLDPKRAQDAQEHHHVG